MLVKYNYNPIESPENVFFSTNSVEEENYFS